MRRPDPLPSGRRAPRPGVEEPRADEERLPYGKQPCLQCGYPISEIAGSKAAICPRCGFKDPCC